MIKKINVQVYLYFRGFDSFQRFWRLRGVDSIKNRVQGVYFGEEYCEYRQPTLTQVREVLDRTKQEGWSFCLMTGIATSRVIKKYLPIYRFLIRKKTLPAVVVNDWGMLYVLRRQFSKLPIVLGRMLTKNKRYIYKHFEPDTGMAGRTASADVVREQMKVLRQSNLSCRAYRDFLKAQGVPRIDLDIPPQGLNLEGLSGLELGCYYPWGYLTSGRTCEFFKAASRFVIVKKCPQANQECPVHLSRSREHRTDLLFTGNTVMYRIESLDLQSEFQRIIYEVDMDGNLDQARTGLIKLLGQGLTVAY